MNTLQTDIKNTLLFIPDISGFTKFVNTTEIQHAKHIIEELLEILIDSNEINLELSEVEGDALLFFRRGKAPTAAELLAQVQKMYINFHAHLKKYATHRICSCGACCSANDLSIKFIAHFGEVADKQVKDRTKLFGKDVIVAHRLMKNSISTDEYSLFSDNLVRACSTWLHLDEVAWSDVIEQEGEYDFGKAKYCFLKLEALEEHIPEPRIEDYSLHGKKDRFLHAEVTIQAPIQTVFDAISDMDFRHHFMHHLKRSDKLNHKIMQQGSTHRCVIHETEKDPFFVAHDFNFDPNKITFVESNHKDKYDNIFSLIAVGKGITRFSVSSFGKFSFIMNLMVKLFMQKKWEKNNERVWNDFKSYCEQLVQENKMHRSQIVLPEKVFA